MTKFKYHTESKTILGDLLTPVSAYLKVRDAYPQSALLESSDYHGGENAKSFIALHPIGTVSIAHGTGRLEYPDGSTVEHKIEAGYTSADLINEFLKSFSIEGADAKYCGLYGYTSLNSVRYFENIKVKDEV
ncbi:MAG: anthranilate synthase component I family protein, partial [Paludibacteraceae bacterium]|nr:anthranilate synthase component I family protein [Paludibacteraceae bacterium]